MQLLLTLDCSCDICISFISSNTIFEYLSFQIMATELWSHILVHVCFALKHGPIIPLLSEKTSYHTNIRTAQRQIRLLKWAAHLNLYGLRSGIWILNDLIWLWRNSFIFIYLFNICVVCLWRFKREAYRLLNKQKL